MKIYNNLGNEILDIQVDDNSYRHRAIMGEHNLTLYFSLPEHVEIPVGAYCEYQGETFTLERPEALKMKHTRLFEYTIVFEAPEAKAKIWKFRNTVDGRLKFSLTAKPVEHLQMFVDNMNRRDAGWTVGECIEGVEQLISYDHAYCADALNQMASEFKTEFEYRGKSVSLKKVQYNKSNPLPLSYGKGNGFKSGIGRSNTGDTPPVEILFVQGGEKNIDPSRYGSSELLLPTLKTLSFDGEHFGGEEGFNQENARTYTTDGDGRFIKRSDKALSSQAEDSLDCSSIYPKRVGEVSQVVTVDVDNNFYDIIDGSIPEQLNYDDYLIKGETMTIIFQSGMLAGREFEVKYYHRPITYSGTPKAGRRFEIVPQEIDGQTMPNETFKPVVGDEYTVFNCMLPDSYVCNNLTKTGASWDMYREAVRYLFENEDQKFTFTGELDGIWAKQDWVNIGGKIILGGYIQFSDARFQPDGVLVRITGIKDYVNNPHSPEIELSNTTVSGGVSSKLKEIETQEVIMEDYHRDALSFTKRRFRDARETIEMLEASLLENFTNSINPITIQTMSMLVGDESLQFRFVSSKTAPVQVSHSIIWSNENKQLKADKGIIQHMTLGLSSISSTHSPSEYHFWTVKSYVSAVLDDPTKKYYLYIKASQSDDTAAFLLSEKAIRMEYEGAYYFLVGVLNSEYDGVRSFVALYGFSEILPGRITTDKIVSPDGQTFFNLSEGIIGGNLKFIGADGNLKNVSSMEYLQNTFSEWATTEIGGGVVLSTLIGVRNEEGTIQAALVGQNPTTESEYPLIFAGAKPINLCHYAWTSTSGDTVFTTSQTVHVGDSVFNKWHIRIGYIAFIMASFESPAFVASNGTTYYQDSSASMVCPVKTEVENANNAKFRVYPDGRVVASNFIMDGGYVLKFQDILCIMTEDDYPTNAQYLDTTYGYCFKLFANSAGKCICLSTHINDNSEERNEGQIVMIFNSSIYAIGLYILGDSASTFEEIAHNAFIEYIHIGGVWRKK